MSDEESTIREVETTPQSMKSWRDLNDQDPNRYPVLLSLSRELDEFEAAVLNRSGTVIVGKVPRTLLIRETTLEEVRDQLPQWTETINSLASQGRRIRDAALAEDARLLALAAEITDSLQNP